MIIQETPTLNLQFDKAKNDSDMLSLLKSQGGTFTRGSEVVGSGDSVASYVDALGTLRYAKLGHPRPNFVDGVNQGLLIEEERTNLLQHSENFDNAYWSKSNTTVTPNAIISPDGTLSGAKLIANTVSGRHVVFRTPVGVGASNTGTVSCYAKAGEYDFLALTVMQGSNSNGILYTFSLIDGAVSQRVLGGYNNVSAISTYEGNGWYRCSITFTNAASNSDFVIIAPSPTLTPSVDSGFKTPAFVGDGTSGIFIFGAQLEAGSFPTSYIPTKSTFVSRASTATYFDQNGVLQTAAINEARDNNHGFINGKWVKTGLLAEEARTNLALMSNDFSDGAWLKVALGTGTGLVLTPNYTTAPDGSNNGWRLQCNLNGGNTTNDRSWLQQNITGTTVPTYASVYAKLNSAGSATFTVSNNGTDTVTLTSTSWVRVGTVRTAAAAAYAFRIGLIGGQGASDSIDISIAFAQIEVGFQPSSYIPTAGTTVTRSADITTSATVTRGADNTSITGTAFSDFYNPEEGTFLVDWESNSLLNDPAIFECFSDSANRIILVHDRVFIQSSSGADIRGYENYTSAKVNYKSGLSYKLNNVGFTIDAQPILEDNVVIIPTATQLILGDDSSGGNILNGHIKRLIYYPKALPDADLQLLTEI